MGSQKLAVHGLYFATEISNALFKLSGASIAVDGTTATVTLAAHLLSDGDYVTFSGTTGVTGLNNATWGPVTVNSSSEYTFPCTLTGTPAGTIVQEKLYFPPIGEWFATLGANGQLEYCPNNALGLVWPDADGSDTTWRILAAASGHATFWTDGLSVRFRENGTTATSYFSKIA